MTTPKSLSPAAQAVLDAANGASSYGLADCLNDAPQIAAATLRAAAGQMIKTDDLTDTVEDVFRGAERHHQAGLLWTIATELEGHHG